MVNNTPAAAGVSKDKMGKKSRKEEVPSPSSTSLTFIHFHLPSSPSNLANWLGLMDIYTSDLEWLLQLQPSEFSSILCTTNIIRVSLSSFLATAPRFYHQQNNDLDLNSNNQIGSVYKKIYSLVFRVWVKILHQFQSDYKLENRIEILSQLSLLYESGENCLLKNLVQKLFQDGDLQTEFSNHVEKLVGRLMQLEREYSRLGVGVGDYKDLESRLDNLLEHLIGLFKLLKNYKEGTGLLLREVQGIGKAYDYLINYWDSVLDTHPYLSNRVHILRIYYLRLLRLVLYRSTIEGVYKDGDLRIDTYFTALSGFLDTKYFILDYEKSYPLESDMDMLKLRGVYIDPARIEYLSNAVKAHFEDVGCHGDNHGAATQISQPKKSSDPLYDPNFDRQLLGACSLDIQGVELESLITQVKDLLPELGRRFVEVCLKHYGYEAEATINALLEGSTPPYLEEWRDAVEEEAVKVEESKDGMTFMKNRKTQDGDLIGDSTLSEESKIIKERILHNLELEEEEKRKRRLEEATKGRPPPSVSQEQDTYLDESLLPNYEDYRDEYNDEYDDTYDEACIGMTEPDNQIRPLNINTRRTKEEEVVIEEEDEEEHPSSSSRMFEGFAENPEITRARWEAKRQAKNTSKQPPGQQQQQQPRDVVGRGRGQGQDKQVLLNRRYKDASGSHNRRSQSDWKRKEF